MRKNSNFSGKRILKRLKIEIKNVKLDKIARKKNPWKTYALKSELYYVNISRVLHYSRLVDQSFWRLLNTNKLDRQTNRQAKYYL